MSGYLLDTNVISKFSPGKPKVPDALGRWMHEQGSLEQLFISTMTIAEITSGIRKLQRKGATARAGSLDSWLNGILTMFHDRILAMDLDVAILVGELDDIVAAKGHEPGLADIIIAATAKKHGLVVVTENIRHFQHFGVTLELPVN